MATSSAVRFIPAVCAMLCAYSPTCTRAQESASQPPAPSRVGEMVPLETVYDGALGPGWNDYGWAAHDVGTGPVHLAAQSYGGWIVAHPGLSGRYGALTFHLLAPREWGDFLEVHVESTQRSAYPRVVVRADRRTDLPGGWSEVVISMRDLNPEGLPFDRITFRASKNVGPGIAALDKIILTRPVVGDHAASATPARDVLLTIDCHGRGEPISPLVYGIAYDPRLDARDRHQWLLGATARRWGATRALASTGRSATHGTRRRTGSSRT